MRPPSTSRKRDANGYSRAIAPSCGDELAICTFSIAVFVIVHVPRPEHFEIARGIGRESGDVSVALAVVHDVVATAVRDHDAIALGHDDARGGELRQSDAGFLEHGFLRGPNAYELARTERREQ